MGMYTELIFGCALKLDTPQGVIGILQGLVKGELDNIKTMDDDFFASERWGYLFRMSSYYFGVNEPQGKIWFDNIAKNWRISTRSNLKNYDNEIEKFLAWIKPYIEGGSGERDMYAIVTYEESLPKIYYLE